MIESSEEENITANSKNKGVVAKKPESTPIKGLKSASSVATPKSLSKSNSGLLKTKSSIHSTPLSSSPTGSVGSSRSSVVDSTKMAKLQSTAEKIRRVNDEKERWAQEKEKRLAFREEQRAQEMKRLLENSQAANEGRRKNWEKKREYEINAKEAEREILATSVEARALQAAELERMKKERRRQSVMLNNEIHESAQKRVAGLKAQQRVEEDSLWESRQVDFLAVKDFQNAEDEKRRESLMMRGIESKRKKLVKAEIESRSADEERDLLDTRRQAWINEQEAKKEETKRKRESIVGRLDAWRNQKAIENEIKNIEVETKADMFFTREQDWRDIQDYKSNQTKKERESLAGRLEKWRRDKAHDNWVKSEDDEAAEIEKELKEQCIEDLRKYEESLKEDRRKSLAYRLDKSKKDNDFTQGQKSLKDFIEKEEIRLREQDREDVQQYRKTLQEARRKSLEYRNQSEFQERMRLKGIAEATKELESEDKELSDQAWRDVKVYQEELRCAARKSLSCRLAESRRHQAVALEEHRQHLDVLHDEFATKYLNWQDVNAYKDQEIEQRRKSISLRLHSWRSQRIAEEKLKARKVLIEEEDARLREQDWEELTKAKELLKIEENLIFTKTGVFL